MLLAVIVTMHEMITTIEAKRVLEPKVFVPK